VLNGNDTSLAEGAPAMSGPVLLEFVDWDLTSKKAAQEIGVAYRTLERWRTDTCIS